MFSYYSSLIVPTHRVASAEGVHYSPGGSLLEYNDSQTGQLSIGFSYEHEKLDRAKYGDKYIPNYNRERTDNSSFTIITSYGITDHISLSAFFPLNIYSIKKSFSGAKMQTCTMVGNTSGSLMV